MLTRDEIQTGYPLELADFVELLQTGSFVEEELRREAPA